MVKQFQLTKQVDLFVAFAHNMLGFLKKEKGLEQDISTTAEASRIKSAKIELKHIHESLLAIAVIPCRCVSKFIMAIICWN